MSLSSEDLNLAMKFLCQDFGGEWLLLGGSLIRFDVDPNRGTHDIDLVRLDSDSIAEKTRLILAMKNFKLSPEQLNSSVDFFLKQIPNWQLHMKLIQNGPRGKLYRPTLTLFAILKFRRGTAIDIADVEAAKNKWGVEEFNKKQFLEWAGEREKTFAKNLNLI